MQKDPQQIIERSPMSKLQITAVAMCILLNALDGFDVLSIAFAAPGITKEWGIARVALGIVLSMELIGMGVGSIFLGGVADKVGRRKTILVSTVVMVIGMFLAGRSHGVYDLSFYRFFTGLGIGGMLAATNAMASEFSNAKAKAMSVMFMAGGYPLGIIVGGIISGHLLKVYSWRAIFDFGAAVTFVFLILSIFFLPESISFLCQKRPAGALDKINAILRKMKHDTIDALPAVCCKSEKKKVGFASLFGPGLISITILMIVAYFGHMMTHYFFLKWVPKIVVDMGYAGPVAGAVLVWANAGGLISSFLMGVLSRRFSTRGLTIIVLLGCSVMMIIFGAGADSLSQLNLVAACAGFFTQACIVGLYALVAKAFPTEVRASGTGLVIGIGRAGACLGPITAGILFSGGFGLQTTAIVMACGSFIGFLALIFLKTKSAEVVADAQVAAK